MPDLLERFPLFPLGLVLLPGEVVPLHIFEDRYKLMIGECLENGTEFGIVWLSDDGLKDIGCTATVSRVLDELDDGRMNILVEGSSPFRLLRRIEDLPYPAGDVELLDDGEESTPDGATARERYAELVERVTDERPDTDDLADLDAYGMASTLDFELDAQQGPLQLRPGQGRPGRPRGPFTPPPARIAPAEGGAGGGPLWAPPGVFPPPPGRPPPGRGGRGGAPGQRGVGPLNWAAGFPPPGGGPPPPVSSPPSGSRATACTPPKYRLVSDQRRTV